MYLSTFIKSLDLICINEYWKTLEKRYSYFKTIPLK